MSRDRYNVTAEQFVTAWQTSSTAGEVAAKLGMPKARVQARASKYRKMGVRLRVMRTPSRRTLLVQRLNALAAELG